MVSLESNGSSSPPSLEEATLPEAVLWALSLCYFPWARASNPLRAAILRDTGNYFSHLIHIMGDVN